MGKFINEYKPQNDLMGLLLNDTVKTKHEQILAISKKLDIDVNSPKVLDLWYALNWYIL